MRDVRITASRILLQSRSALLKIAIEFSLIAGRLATEHLLLGPIAWPRRIARRILRERLRPLDLFVDPAIYPRQFDARRRKRVSRDPALHYTLVGRYHNFAPNRDFDPVYYRSNTPELNWSEDPLAHFIALNASAATRETAERSTRLHVQNAVSEIVVTINHGRGGGSTKFLSLYEASLHARGVTTFRLARTSNKQPLFRFMQDTTPAGDTVFHLDEDEALLVDAIRQTGATRLLINHFVDIADGFDRLSRLAQLAELPFDVILHDYFTACPRVVLVDRTRRYCHEPPPAICSVCLRGHEISDIHRHRTAAGRMLRAADMVIVPSLDAAERLAKFWPDRRMEVWNPEDDRLLERQHLPALHADEKLRVVIIGGLSVFKGYDVVRSLAQAIDIAKLPIQLIVVGPSENDQHLKSLGVVVHGLYSEPTIDGLLANYRPHVAFLPSICPETWCFALTIALRNRLHVTALDIGAPSDRLRQLQRGALLPRSIVDRPAQLAEHFMRLRDKLISPHREAKSALRLSS